MSELTVSGALDGSLGMNDLRLQPEALLHQADLAERNGNPQLGQNLRRAAELSALSDQDVLSIYEALRPSRSSVEELTAIAARLQAQGAALCAALVTEAAAAYQRRGLLR